MHDGLSFTRAGGDRAPCRAGSHGYRQSYDALTAEQKRLVVKFLNTL